jgi:hypothetical protein
VGLTKRALEGLIFGLVVFAVLEGGCDDRASQIAACKSMCKPRLVLEFTAQAGCKCSEK